jgi:hypothetical protein
MDSPVHRHHRVDCDKVMEPFARGAGHGRGERPHDAVTPWLPSDVEICLMAARFDGMPDLIERAKTKGWSDRLRPKANYGAKRTERGERK